MSNNTTAAAPTTCEMHFKDIVLVFLYVVVIILGVVGNACICYIFGYRNHHSKTVTELLIVYLAIFDLLASIFAPFVFMYWILTCSTWHFGIIGCKILPLLSRVFINISVGIILILAVDRFQAICIPFRGQFAKKNIHIAVIVTILLSFVCESYYIEALAIGTGRLSGCIVEPNNKILYIKVTSSILIARDSLYIICFTTTTFGIAFTIRKRDLYFTAPQNMSRQEMGRVVRVVIVMQLVFLILLLPRDIFHILFSLSWLGGKGIPYTDEIETLNEFLKLFQTANCCANIFVYAKLHDRFRSRFLEVIQQSIGCGSPASATAVALRYNRQLLVRTDERQTQSFRDVEFYTPKLSKRMEGYMANGK